VYLVTAASDVLLMHFKFGRYVHALLFVLKPHLLVIAEKVVFAEYLLLVVICVAHNSSEEVENKKIAEEDEDHEEEGPVYIILDNWLHVDPHRVDAVVHHIDPALGGRHLKHGGDGLCHVIEV
jgi:hypothetical protein